jgi:hypothetical protein
MAGFINDVGVNMNMPGNQAVNYSLAVTERWSYLR